MEPDRESEAHSTRRGFPIPSPYRPRLSIEITEDQNADLKAMIPWGVKNALFSIIIDDVIKKLKAHGTIFIAAVLDRKIKLDDYVDFGGVEDGDDQ